MDYLVTFSEDAGGGYYAQVPDLPGCQAYGSTLEEARANINEAIALWFETWCDKPASR